MPIAKGGFESELKKRIGKSRRLAVVGVGDELHARDRLGMLAARAIEALALPDVTVFLAGNLPESFTGPIRRYAPDHVILLDAADMRMPPGTVAVVDAPRVHGERLTTHALPLTVVMEYLEKELGIPATLVGLQPDMESAAPAPTNAEQKGMDGLARVLREARLAKRRD